MIETVETFVIIELGADPAGAVIGIVETFIIIELGAWPSRSSDSDC